MNDTRIRVVSFLIKEGQILLGQKKEGFGKGKLVGIGGKVEEGETNLEGAIREIKEEILVETLEIEECVQLEFDFPHKPDWSQKGIAYMVTKWEGVPQETDEIKPLWFNFKEIPFDQMWDDARYWLPAMLAGKKMNTHFIYNIDDVVEKIDIELF